MPLRPPLLIFTLEVDTLREEEMGVENDPSFSVELEQDDVTEIKTKCARSKVSSMGSLQLPKPVKIFPVHLQVKSIWSGLSRRSLVFLQNALPNSILLRNISYKGGYFMWWILPYLALTILL